MNIEATFSCYSSITTKLVLHLLATQENKGK